MASKACGGDIDRQHSWANQWEATVQDITLFVNEQEGGTTQSQACNPGGTGRGITQHHWRPNDSRKCCANPKCLKAFSFLERHHHCRRCGDVFCNQCTNYQRKLNALAHPDPNGRLYKVCQACFDQGPQTIGQTQVHTHLFQHFRKHKCVAMGENGMSGCQRDGRFSVTNFRDKLDLARECDRLKTGFSVDVKKNGIIRAFNDVKHLVSFPDWQKSTFWQLGNSVTMCYQCKKEFGIGRGKHSCTVCGVRICSDCSTKDLLVYYEDNDREEEDINFQPKLSVIKIVGCPKKEPEVSMYLRICTLCQEKIQETQISKYHSAIADEERFMKESGEQDFWNQLEKTMIRIRKIHRQIEDQLPKYQELIDALEISAGSPQSLPNSRNNMQVLAKSQGDLADHTTQIIMTIHNLKPLKPNSRGQMTVIKNIIRSQCDYYAEIMWQFRSLKRKLENVTPIEVLTSIQSIVDRNAINSGYLSVKQLTFEVLHLCSKHRLTHNFVKRLIVCEEVVRSDLQNAVAAAGEDWHSHSSCVNELLQIQLKDHRFIRPSRRLTKRYGAKHIKYILYERSDSILQQVFLQLSAKCAEKSFRRPKEVLRTLREDLPTIFHEMCVVKEDDWDFCEDES